MCDLEVMTVTSPIGSYVVQACGRGLHEVKLAAEVDNHNFIQKGHAHVEVTGVGPPQNHHLLAVQNWLVAFFTPLESKGRPRGVEDIIVCPEVAGLEDTTRTFRQKVWITLKDQVALGETITYGQLATLCGSGGASRAVGSAMANNPISLIIPCHRVVKSDGSTGNYSKGTKNDMKSWLLRHEKLLSDDPSDNAG